MASVSVRHEAPVRAATGQRRLPWPVTAFIVSIFVPLSVYVGPLQLSANRLVLLIAVVPCLFMLVTGRVGPVRSSDVLLIGLCLWAALSLSVVHGPLATVMTSAGPAWMVEAIGIFAIETLGGYLIARCFVRTPDHFFQLVRLLLIGFLALLPFAVIEALTGRNLPLEVFGSLGQVSPLVVKEPRWGLDRVQAVFDHPIHFGVVGCSLVALTFYVIGYGRAVLARVVMTTLVVAGAFLSLSSGPLVGIISQLGFMAWGQIFAFIRERWLLLTASAGSMIALVELVANRSSPEILIGILAFNQHTAYNRIRIWHFGTQSVAEHPWFGIGFNEWVRGGGMSDSVDMFWLVPAILHGVPAGLLQVFAVACLFFAVVRVRFRSERLQHYKLGWCLCMLGLFLAGWTVHYWREIYTLFLFLLGCGAWFVDWKNPEAGTDTTRPSPDRKRGAWYAHLAGRSDTPAAPGPSGSLWRRSP